MRWRGWWYHHKALAGYIVLVAVAAGGALLYQTHTVRVLNRHDRQSCQQRNRLATNQRFVFETLELVLIRELNNPNITPGGKFALEQKLGELEAKLPDVGPESC